MANIHVDRPAKEKPFYEDFKSLNLRNRYKFSKTFEVKRETIDWDRDMYRNIYTGSFTIDNEIKVKFSLRSTGGMFIADVEDLLKDEEQREVYELAIRELHYRFTDYYEPELLELKEKFIDGKVTYFINEFIDIDEKFDTKRVLDNIDSYLETKVFYTDNNGYEEDITEIYCETSLKHMVEEEVECFRDFLKANAFYMMCRVFTATEEEDYELDEDYKLDYYKEKIKLDYSRFRFEVKVYNLVTKD